MNTLLAVAALIAVVESSPYHYVQPPTQPPCASVANNFCQGRADQYYGHPSDCGCFIRCVSNVIHGPQVCAAGTVFCQKKQTCIHGNRATCTLASWATCEVPPTVTVQTPTRPASNCTGYNEDPLNFCGNQYCAGKPNSYYHHCTYHFAYPNDCTCFYQCRAVDTITHIMPCPYGTHWSQADLTCVHGAC